MAHRLVEVGEKIKIRHGLHKGKFGVVQAHERHDYWKFDTAVSFRRRFRATLLTYVVEVEGVGLRRVPGSYLDLIDG